VPRHRPPEGRPISTDDDHIRRDQPPPRGYDDRGGYDRPPPGYDDRRDDYRRPYPPRPAYDVRRGRPDEDREQLRLLAIFH
jgi:hypothetical protein